MYKHLLREGSFISLDDNDEEEDGKDVDEDEDDDEEVSVAYKALFSLAIKGLRSRVSGN